MDRLSSSSWLQWYTGKWHSWEYGARATRCGRINAEHLRQNPAAALSHDPPEPGSDVCTTCARKSGYLERALALPGGAASEWCGLLRRQLQYNHVRIGERELEQLSRRLGELGPPTEAEPRAVYEQLRWLILKPTWTRKQNVVGVTRSFATVPHLKECLAALPPGPETLRKLAAQLQGWRAETGRDIAAETSFRPDRVLAVALELPSPVNPYVKQVRASSNGLATLAFIFHPATLSRAREETALRGFFRGTNTYWESTAASQLNIVRE